MLASDRAPHGPGASAVPSGVVKVVQERVVPCGLEAVRRLEARVAAKLSDVRALETVTADQFPGHFARVVQGVLSARPYQGAIVRETPASQVRAILRAGREGWVGPEELPELAGWLSGAPAEARLDLACELLHGSSPDRVALLSRWVWNPHRRTGILSEFGGPPATSYPEAQARLGEVRLEIGALGLPSASFAGVDVVLALAYAGRLQTTTDDQLHSGGLESLLPGPFPLATMILGVRRRTTDAGR